MKLKSWELWLFSGISFLFVGIVYLIRNTYFLGAIFTLLGGFYLFLSKTNYKGDNKPAVAKVPDKVLKNMDVELRSLLAEGKKIKAIKKYRVVTGLGLKEAKEYVDALQSESN